MNKNWVLPQCDFSLFFFSPKNLVSKLIKMMKLDDDRNFVKKKKLRRFFSSVLFFRLALCKEWHKEKGSFFVHLMWKFFGMNKTEETKRKLANNTLMSLLKFSIYETCKKNWLNFFQGCPTCTSLLCTSLLWLCLQFGASAIHIFTQCLFNIWAQ